MKNYIATCNTLNLSFLPTLKKIHFEDLVIETQFKIDQFWCLQDLKQLLKTISDQRHFWSMKATTMFSNSSRATKEGRKTQHTAELLVTIHFVNIYISD